MNDIQYCIECEREVFVGTRDYHIVFGTLECGCIDVDHECFGPFVEYGPEELPEYWQDELTDPSAEELAEMDANAEEFLMSLQ